MAPFKLVTTPRYCVGSDEGPKVTTLDVIQPRVEITQSRPPTAPAGYLEEGMLTEYWVGRLVIALAKARLIGTQPLWRSCRLWDNEMRTRPGCPAVFARITPRIAPENPRRCEKCQQSTESPWSARTA